MADEKFKRAVYREDGGAWLVAVFYDSTDDKGMRRVKLECLEQIKPSPDYGPIDVGEILESTMQKGYEAYVGWSLDYDGVGDA